MKNSLFNSGSKTIILAGLMAGTLDILCAVIILAKGNVIGTLRFIAKGALGLSAFTGGYVMVFAGLLIHYLIAFIFAAAYFFAFPFFPFLKKQQLISGLLYGILVWAVMHYVVLPFTYNVPWPFTIQGSWKEIVILMLAVGLPVSLITAKHYRVK